jgi:hypothetical protein
MEFQFVSEIATWMKRNDRTKSRCLAGIKIELHFGSFEKLASKQDVIRTVRHVKTNTL